MVAPRSRGGRWVVVPAEPSVARERVAIRRLRRRRRRILRLLLVAAVGTGGWTFLDPSWLSVNLAIDGALIIYVGYLIEAKRRLAERVAKVRRLQPRRNARGPLVEPFDTYLEPLEAGRG